jgi:hypothetical protein
MVLVMTGVPVTVAVDVAVEVKVGDAVAVTLCVPVRVDVAVAVSSSLEEATAESDAGPLLPVVATTTIGTVTAAPTSSGNNKDLNIRANISKNATFII